MALGAAGAVDARLPGIGPWTLGYVALRSGDDDAFLPTDLGVRHGLEALGQDPPRGGADRGTVAAVPRARRGAPVGGRYAAAAAFASCQGVSTRGPSAVIATVNSKWAASEPSWE